MDKTNKYCGCKNEKQGSSHCNADDTMKSKGSRSNDRSDNTGSNDETAESDYSDLD